MTSSRSVSRRTCEILFPLETPCGCAAIESEMRRERMVDAREWIRGKGKVYQMQE